MTTNQLIEQGFVHLSDLTYNQQKVELWENDEYFILFNPKTQEVIYEEEKTES